MQSKAKTIPQYINEQSKSVQQTLRNIHTTILKVAPKAEEGIAYGMPAFKLAGKPLAYFAAFKGHIGLYPTPETITPFAKDLAKYSVGKGCIRFPYTAPVPLPLIKKIVSFRAKEILKK